jgi:Mg-chelatase subunit ChlI
MATPDLTGLTEDELRQTIADARRELARQDVLGDAERTIASLLADARLLGVSKGRALAAMTRIVDAVYALPPTPEKPETPPATPTTT